MSQNKSTKFGHPTTKSLILSAGFGTRLKPLTEKIPKPLATVLNQALFDTALNQLQVTGCSHIAYNTHHLHQLMEQHACVVFKTKPTLSPHLSFETPEILGTGGALAAISNWWGPSDLLVYNGDIISNISFQALKEQHFQYKAQNKGQNKAIVTMVARPGAPSGRSRSLWVDQHHRVRAICVPEDLFRQGDLDHSYRLNQYSFACAYLASPELRAYFPAYHQSFDIVDSLQAAISDGQKIMIVPFDGFWHDAGDPTSLWAANIEMASANSVLLNQVYGHHIPDRVQVEVPVDVYLDRQSVIAKNVTLGARASIKRSVLLDGAVVLEDESLDCVIRGLGLDHKCSHE